MSLIWLLIFFSANDDRYSKSNGVNFNKARGNVITSASSETECWKLRGKHKFLAVTGGIYVKGYNYLSNLLHMWKVFHNHANGRSDFWRITMSVWYFTEHVPRNIVAKLIHKLVLSRITSFADLMAKINSINTKSNSAADGVSFC